MNARLKLYPTFFRLGLVLILYFIIPKITLKMKHLYFFFFILLQWCLPRVSAQPVKAYKDLNGYLTNTYTMMDSIAIRKEKTGGYIVRSEYVRLGHNNKSLVWSDRNVTKMVNKKYWAIERNDSLFVNNAILLKLTKYNKRKRTGDNYKPFGFEYIAFRSSKYLYFKGPLSNVPGVNGITRKGYPNNSGIGSPGLGAVMLAGTITALTTEPGVSRFDYLFDIPQNKTIYFNRGVMRRYVAAASPEEDSAFIRYVTNIIDTME